MEKFIKQNYKPENNFDSEQIAFLEDKLTSLMIRLHNIEKNINSVKLDINFFLQDIRESKYVEGTKK